MGSRNRFSVARPCCGTCLYQASDGNEWSDPFDSLDTGWTVQYPATDTFTANGTLVCQSSGGPPGTSSNLYRDATITPEGLKAILECNVYRHDASATTGLYFTDGYNFRVFARWGATGIGIYAFGSWVVVGNSVQSGDKLSMRIEHLSDGQYRACYHHNEQRIYEATRSWTFSTSVRHGLACTPGGTLPSTIGEWDNYSCHISNP